MRFLGLYLLTVVTFSAGFAKGHSHQSNPLIKTKEEVIAFLDTLTEGGRKRDVATLDRLYSDDYSHTNPDGSIMTKAQVLVSYKAPPTAVIESDQHDEDAELNPAVPSCAGLLERSHWIFFKCIAIRANCVPHWTQITFSIAR